MTKMNKIAAGLAASLLLVSAAQAQETVTSTATATVQNAFTFEEVSALDFGTFRATNDGTDTATLVIPADTATSPSTPTNGDAVIQQLIEGSPGEYSISGVAEFGTLTVTLPTTATLAPVGNPAGVASFTAGPFTAYKTSGTPAAFTTSLQVDGTGAATFNLGATLTTIAGADSYQDGPYEGEYTITVNY